jgi:hypothetical protein
VTIFRFNVPIVGIPQKTSMAVGIPLFRSSRQDARSAEKRDGGNWTRFAGRASPLVRTEHNEWGASLLNSAYVALGICDQGVLSIQ